MLWASFAGCDGRTGHVNSIEGTRSMISHRPAKILCALVFGGALFALMPDNGYAWGHDRDALFAYNAWAGYTVPIQAVYQFPAAQVNQLGVELPLAPPVPFFIRVGEHHVLLR
jgi:hypothetical protein